MSRRPRFPAHTRSTRRRHSLRAQHRRRRADLQAAQGLPGLRLDSAVPLCGHGRRHGRPLPQRHRPGPSAADVFATGDRKLFRKHGQSDRRICRAWASTSISLRSLDLAFEARRTVMSSRRFRPIRKSHRLCPRISRRTGARQACSAAASTSPDSAKASSTPTTNFPSIDKSWKNLWEEDLVPYRTLAPRTSLRHGFDTPPIPRSPRTATPGIAVEEVDHRHPAQEDRLPRPDRLRRSGDGRRAESCADRAGCGRAHSRRRRSVPDLPQRRVRHPLLRSTDPRSRDAIVKFAQRADESVARVLAFKKKSSALKRAGRRLQPPRSWRIFRAGMGIQRAGPPRHHHNQETAHDRRRHHERNLRRRHQRRAGADLSLRRPGRARANSPA